MTLAYGPAGHSAELGGCRIVSAQAPMPGVGEIFHPRMLTSEGPKIPHPSSAMHRGREAAENRLHHDPHCALRSSQRLAP
ncbi:hypothetical protein GCM10017711_33160 [Paeniglutamicibacter sulfureus]